MICLTMICKAALMEVVFASICDQVSFEQVEDANGDSEVEGPSA